MTLQWILVGALALGLSSPSHAAFQTFTDRAAWETAVAAAGMTVETNDFSSDPGTAFTLGPADMTRTLGTHDAANGWLEGGLVRFGFVGGGPIYGLALDYGIQGAGTANGLVRTRDTNGLGSSQFWFSSSGDTFAGVLSDVPLSDVCGTVFTCPGFGEDEIYLTSQPAAMGYVDNLSVAAPASAVVPALPAWGVVGVILASLATARRALGSLKRTAEAA